MLTYLAQPYTNNPQENYETAKHLTSIALEAGYAVFSPVLYFHELSKSEATRNKSYSFWIKNCLEMMNRCDAVLFLELPNWQYSKGMQLEEQFALQVGMLTERISEDYNIEEELCNALGSLMVKSAHQPVRFEE